MLSWFMENLATILICLGVAAVVAVIIIHMIREKRKGKTSCGCGCAGCPMSGSCHKKN